MFVFGALFRKFCFVGQIVLGLMRVKPGILSYALSNEIVFLSKFSAIAA